MPITAIYRGKITATCESCGDAEETETESTMPEYAPLPLGFVHVGFLPYFVTLCGKCSAEATIITHHRVIPLVKDPKET